MTHGYWQSAAADAEMQDDHEFVWRAMLDTIDVDLAGKRVLDIGCNRGGFLRLLADECGIAEGCGYDPAARAIADAQRLQDSRPLEFQAADTVPTTWTGFDVAFSHEVLYLLEDLPAHAETIFKALSPGGAYYAVTGVHADAPLMVNWHRASTDEMQLPKLYDIDQVIAVFQDAGYHAAAARLAIRFVPAAGHGHSGRDRMLDWISYYYEQKLLLRFRRPNRPTPPLTDGPAHR